MKFTREQLHAKGFRPDGNGGLVRMVAESETLGHYAAVEFQSSPKPAIRVSRGLNGVEKRWLEVLRGRHPNAVIQPQFRVRVSAFDSPTVTHYKADFAVMTEHEKSPEFWCCVLWECKDSRRRPHSDELTRPKMARQNNPWISAIWLATWDGITWRERILA